MILPNFDTITNVDTGLVFMLGSLVIGYLRKISATIEKCNEVVGKLHSRLLVIEADYAAHIKYTENRGKQ